MMKRCPAILLLLLLSACAEEQDSPAPDIAAGRAFAEAHCAGCHAMDGRGKTGDIPNLAAQNADYLVESMHAYREGRRRHAALRELFEGMKGSDIRNIASYFASLPPIEPVPATREGENAWREGEEFAAGCFLCHGEGGFSTTAGVPSLAGQQPVYLIVATQEYASGKRGHAEKEAMLEGLDKVDIEKLAMYFAAQDPPLRQPPPFGAPDAGEPLTAVCGGCHGARGVGHEPMVPNLAGQEPHYLVSAITAYRNQERSHEDMITDKSDEDIENIAAFYSAQAAGSAIDAGERVEEVIAKCDRCHGKAVGETTMVVPNLHGQKKDYLISVMRQYRDDDRGHTMMHKMSSSYDDEMIESIASWYANRPAR